MTLEKLKSNTRKELASLAKRHQVAGWHGMRKEELIEALLDVQRARTPSSSRGETVRGDSARPDGSRNVRSVARVNKPQRHDPRPVESPKPVEPRRGSGTPSLIAGNLNGTTAHVPAPRPRPTCGSKTVRKDLSTVGPQEMVQEELTAVAHDPFWIHARWVLRPVTVQRAEVGLGAEWFRAIPVIRLYAVEGDDVKGINARWIRDVEIHGECDHWFVPVENPPGVYKLQIGYLTPSGRFFALAKSRRVVTPRPGSKAAERINWNRSAATVPNNFRPAVTRGSVTDPQFEKFLAARASTQALENGHGLKHPPGVPFHLDTELVVSGTAAPNGQLTFQGEQIKVGRDGKFSLRVTLNDGRQVLPAVTISPDGSEQRTIILAIERNTKELEPQAVDNA